MAFRFNFASFNTNIEQIGTALPEENLFKKDTLFIRGGNSRYILDADLDQIQKHFPQATLETIPNAGHWLHAENPKMFFEIVQQFLNQ